MLSRIFALGFSLLLAFPALAQQPSTLATVNLRIPYGQSVWLYSLPSAQIVSPFRVVYVPSPTCTQFSVRPRVQYQGNPALFEVSYQNNLFYGKNEAVTAIEVNFVQNQFSFQDCQVSLQSFAPTPAPGNRAYAGLLEHSGGFIQRKVLALTQSFYTQEIELVIPDYCQGYEVQQLGVNGMTGYIAAETTRSKSLIFRLPSARLISQIEVSLLAPVGQSCQIPVYVKALAPLPPAP